MKVEFLQARLEVTEKEWEKANKKWMNADDKDRVIAFDANMKVKNSMTKMAFLNGQRKILKELIAWENKTSTKSIRSLYKGCGRMKTETELKAKIDDLNMRQAIGILKGESALSLFQIAAARETLVWVLDEKKETQTNHKDAITKEGKTE